MPRQSTIAPLSSVPFAAIRPAAAGEHPPLGGLLERIRSWSEDEAGRERAMRVSGFPLTDDMSAFLLFVELAYQGASRPTDLARSMATGRSNVAKIVARLEAAEVVGRAADPEDNRAIVVHLTPRGLSMAQRLIEHGDRFFVGLLSEWTEQDRDDLHRLLARLVSTLETSAPTTD